NTVNGESGATGDLRGDGISNLNSSVALQRLSSNMPIAYVAGEVGTQVSDVAGARFQIARWLCGSHTILFPSGTNVLGLQEGSLNIYFYGEPTADRFTPDRWRTQFDPNVLLTAPSKVP